MGVVAFVEPRPNLRPAVAAGLQARGHQLIDVVDERAQLPAIGRAGLALVVADLDRSGVDGPAQVELLRALAAVPVLAVSARAEAAVKVAVLDAGADDYVSRPFDPTELAARIRVLLRRSSAAPEPMGVGGEAVTRFGPFELNRAERMLRRDGARVALTPNELGLLLVLAANPGRLLSHETLLKAVWGPAYGTESAYLRTFISQLRRKLGDDAARPRLIRTEPGLGYRWIAEPERGA